MQMKHSITSLSQGQEVLFHFSFKGAAVVIFLFIVVICAESSVIFKWHKWKVGLESRLLPEWDTYEQASIQTFHHLQNLGFENRGVYSPFLPLTREFTFLLTYFSLYFNVYILQLWYFFYSDFLQGCVVIGQGGTALN